jgi:hypothetical protein
MVSEEPYAAHYKAKPPATSIKHLEQMADNLTKAMNKAAEDSNDRFATGTNGNFFFGSFLPPFLDEE